MLKLDLYVFKIKLLVGGFFLINRKLEIGKFDNFLFVILWVFEVGLLVV